MSNHMTDAEYEASGDVKNADGESEAFERSDAAKVAAVAARLESLANFRECFTDPHDFDIEIDTIRAALRDPDSALAAVRAEAWEEGEAAGLNNASVAEDGEFTENPYRVDRS